MNSRQRIGLSVISVALMSGCAASGMTGYSSYNASYYVVISSNQDEYQTIIENDFIDTEVENSSAISLSANTASYANLRSSILNNREISPDQIRIEEIINYFHYDYPQPEVGDLFGSTSWLMPTPWNEDTYLLTLGLQALDIERSSIANNIVFLLDVSGSMTDPNKLPLLQQSMELLIQELDEDDRVSIVTYAGTVRTVLDGGYGDEKTKLSALISDLYADGSTAGAQGIQTAYQLAQKHFIEGGNNRIILATDGDFNVGISNPSELGDFIAEKRETGVYLSVLGFGYGNYKDNTLESLASKGNGNYAYIDNLLEAKKALIEDINGTLYTVARDAKAQITFNQELVDSFRLIGYENRQLTEDEFENSETDAGEIGAGHRVTVVYELKLHEIEDIDELANLVIRYKNADVSDETQHQDVLSLSLSTMDSITDDTLFITSLIEMSLVLRDSNFKGTASLSAAKRRINSLESVADDPYKVELLSLLSLLMDR